MKYSIVAVASKTGQSIHRVNYSMGNVEANNFDEAMGKALKIGKKLYRGEEGYYDLSVHAIAHDEQVINADGDVSVRAN